MKFIKLLIIILFFSTNIFADTIYYLLKIPNLEIIDFKNNNQIKIFKAKKFFKVGLRDNNVECYNPSNKLLREKQNLINNNIDIYSNFFLDKINLKFIVLCKNLEVASIPALGVPNHPLKTIILNIDVDNYRLSRTIHHEIFHVINDQFSELFDYDEWRNFNSKVFEYKTCSTCTDKFGMELLADKKGFFTEYSQSTVGEDMAETFSFLMIKNSEIKKIVQDDIILKKKIRYIKSNILLIDQNFKFTL